MENTLKVLKIDWFFGKNNQRRMIFLGMILVSGTFPRAGWLNLSLRVRNSLSERDDF